MAQRSEARVRRTAPASGGRRLERRSTPRSGPAPDDRFFRHIVSSMRNGSIAFRRDGTLALMNDEAYRTFGIPKSPDDMGRPFADVLRSVPDAIRVMSAAFELSYLPNRAELRLKELDRVVGYTLSQVKDDTGT